MSVWQQGKALSALPHLEQGASIMLDELVWWNGALKTAREKTAQKLTAPAARLRSSSAPRPRRGRWSRSGRALGSS